MRALIVVMACGAACGGTASSTRPPPVAQPAATTVEPSPPAAGVAGGPAVTATPPEAEPLTETPPVVQIVDPGAAPRRVLRYRFRSGAVEEFELDIKMAMEIQIKEPSTGLDRANRIDVPTIRTVMRATTTEVTPEGDGHILWDLDKVVLLPDSTFTAEQRAAVETELKQLVGMRGSARISTRGVVSEMVFQTPNAAPKMAQQLDSMRDSMRQMYVPLPEGEVGSGAAWDVTSRIPIGGALADMKYTYSKVRFTGAAVAVLVEYSMTARGQPMKIAPGVAGTLDELTGGGSGSLALALDRLTAGGTVRFTTAMKFSAAGAQGAMKMEGTVTTRSGKPARR